MQTDYLQFIFQAITNLLTQNLGFFDAMGQNLFRMFATILIVWFGVKSALSAASGRGGFHFENFASLLLTISFGFAMVNYYSNPIPGMGTSFHNLITDESQFLANKITQTQLQVVIERVADFESRMDSPGFGDFLGTLIYTAVTILLAAAQAIAIVVIAYGFIATAVCVLVGPIFIPFFIVPQLEWIFWGWFKAFIQYAFYQVIAAAVVFIIANLILGTMNLQPNGTISTTQLLEFFPVLFITFLASIYALLKIPALTNHIFSGSFRRVFRRHPGGHEAMSNDSSFHDAKRLYLEQYGDPMVTNTYLKIALVLLAFVAVGLGLIDMRTIRTFQNFRPLVIRIDQLGRAEALSYANFEYKPQDAEAKYFLSQFCALYYRRNRYTMNDDFSKSLYFLDGKLASDIIDAYKKNGVIKSFLTDPSQPEIDIEVKNVALEGMQTSPYKARVDFDMVYYSAADHSELKRTLYTANFVFVFKTNVPNELIPINPLGLAITYFREDEAFK